jgi:hypothetical protein
MIFCCETPQQMGRPPKISARDLSLRLMTEGPTSAADLAARWHVDRSTVVRTLGEIGSDLVSVGATRRTRYALRRKVRESDTTFPLYRIDATGRAKAWGTLEAFHRAWRVTWTGATPAWATHFSDPEGLWEGFPFFLGDIRPQGFLGRAILRRISRTHRLPEDLRHWEDDDTLMFLASCGEDLPGDLVVGDDCLRRALALQVTPTAESTLAPHEVATRYPELAARAATDPPPGSSAAGQNPKFLATLQEGSERRQVLVKFSPPIHQAVGLRWADLMAMEFHALSILAEAGLAEPGHRLLDADGRRFLEVPRFDRTPPGGRNGVVSLEALHGSAIGGNPSDWTSRVLDLEQVGLVNAAAVRNTRRLQAFGELIGNTDMHAGNLAFRITDTLPFELAPAYDMLPMLWAPGPQGELMDRTFAPQPPVPAAAEAWREMLSLAREFWNRVIADQRVSREFAAIARKAGDVLTRLHERFG